jgi:hypothetical protein
MPIPPDIIAIDHDDYHASHVGHTSHGHQFFLTTPFVPPIDKHTVSREFVARFLFDADGALLEARIDDLGSREDLDEQHAQQVFDQRLRELGEVEYGRILVRPFQIVRFGTTFGLVPHAPDGKNVDWWWVSLEPGDYMAFHEPWDSGIYDT